MRVLQTLLFLGILYSFSSASAQELKNITPFEDSIKMLVARLSEVLEFDSLVKSGWAGKLATRSIIRLKERPSSTQPQYYKLDVGTYSDAAYDDHFFHWETFYYNAPENQILINVMGRKPMAMAQYRKWKARGPSLGERLLSIFGTRCR